MSEPAQHCDRCDSDFEGAATALRIESGPLQPAHGSMTLCPHCTDSMGRWIDRRKTRSRPSPAPQAPQAPEAEAGAGEETRRSSESRRSSRRRRKQVKKAKQQATRIVTAVLVLGVASIVAMGAGVFFLKWAASP